MSGGGFGNCKSLEYQNMGHLEQKKVSHACRTHQTEEDNQEGTRCKKNHSKSSSMSD